MANPVERYLKLGYKEALERSYLYPLACKELSMILRGAYNQLPKNLQSTVFHDTLSSFRLLPVMQTSSAVFAAHNLFQSADSVLPKQKKNLATTEFKHAKVAHKRRNKLQQEQEGLADLPDDILVHIFSYLDVQSLLSAALVNWSWNFAASNNDLWQSQYSKVFGDNSRSSKTEKQRNGKSLRDKDSRLLQGSKESTAVDWRQVFKTAYQGESSQRITSCRGYCYQCKAIVWLDNMNCLNKENGQQYGSHRIIPISSRQVVDYLLHCSSSLLFTSNSDSDSDSDSDEGSTSKLWALPKVFAYHDSEAAHLQLIEKIARSDRR